MMFSSCVVQCEKTSTQDQGSACLKKNSVAGADPYGKPKRRKAPDYLMLWFRLHCEYGKTLLVDL